ncbi:hypothetical protein [Myxococcus xanthus]|uniref:Uncharacterized protein n=1 Tax=Myxococcus xanthus TaxID=34 RepID=A0AAE6KR69_MYXXA|nr:hypothetical protein [Myxococcus xanthus]QDE66834.1 hypothetical protein BHS09_07285 [Myxococcus xanthus]QDE74107.1 hypothetical protein BHS08_07290 [Myxococcus xanthus]QDE95702.1 hypothetical protein BHS05_07300 [Myxococcus xanthus]
MLRSPLAHMRPSPTEFDRQYTEQRRSIELARRYLEKEGVSRMYDALSKEVERGRLSVQDASGAIRFGLLAVIERVAERVGHTHYVDMLKDEEMLNALRSTLDDICRRKGVDTYEFRQQWAHTNLQAVLRDWHLVVHEERGRQRYEVAADLARRLVKETPGTVLAQTLKLPVDAFVLLVSPEAGLVGLGPDGAPAPVTEIYAVESPAPEGKAWFLWLNMRDAGNRAARALINVYLQDGKTLDDAIAFTREQGGPQQDAGWEDCCRLLAGVTRHMAEGGPVREVWYDATARDLHEKLAATPKSAKADREKLRERLRAVSPGRTLVLEEPSR